MAALKKKVERLTADQMQVLHHLRRERRVMITGCAGSGKTLLVAEKAIRFDSAGLRTLVLCHNPNLARHMSGLISNRAVDVFDIGEFVSMLAGVATSSRPEWTIFEEPLDEDIRLASAAVRLAAPTYEAVLVDEGQDFKEAWWSLVEQLLEHSESSRLYIFCDDNQALLPHRGRYPFHAPSISMSRNCRNAGNIFEIVKRFHRDAPLTSSFRAAEGIARVTPFNEGEFDRRLEWALVDACAHAPLSHIRVLTSEPSAESSAINGFSFTRVPSHDWRTVVEADLRALLARAMKRLSRLRSGNSHSKIAKRFGLPLQPNFDEHLAIPTLSRALLPTPQDVRLVQSFATKLLPFFESDQSNVAEVTFSKDKQGPYLAATTHNGRAIPVNNTAKVRHYASPGWHSALISAPRAVVRAGEMPDTSTLRLQSIDAFKGLECDAIVLVVMSASHNLMRELYVGASRAVGYLNIVLSRGTLAKLTSLDDLGDEFMVT